MIKGLAITPPTIGRISIGRVVERNGKRLPEKDDQFTITSQVQGKDGWIHHPIDEALRKQSANQKLRSIPVSLIFNDPELNFRAEYSMFDRNSNRPLCVGNGEVCRRVTQDGIQTLPCPSPMQCDLAQEGYCKPYGRLHVKIDEQDDLGTFVFRTTGFNSIKTLSARLRYYQAISGDRLACLPLDLKIRGKSTALSFRTPVYYADLTLREGMSMEQAIQVAAELDECRKQAGINQIALDQTAKRCLANSDFEYTLDESMEIVEEFYPELNDNGDDYNYIPDELHGLSDKMDVLLDKGSNK